MAAVLADSSVWGSAFPRKPNDTLQSLLAADQLLCHPLIVLELACGTPPGPRERTLGDLKTLQTSVVATTEETFELIERERLQDLGCGAGRYFSACIHPSHPRRLAVDRR